MIKVNGLTYSYKGINSKHDVFKNLNIEFGQGLNAILGPNGSGKTTLLKSIFGLLKYEGAIYFGTENVTNMNRDEKAKLMSYLPQMDVEFSMLKVLEMVLLGRLPDLKQRISDEDLNAVMETLEALNIKELATRNFGELSGGQKKLVFIAQTLVRDPKIILLDEPVNSLDLQKQLELCDLLQNIVERKNISIIVVLHDINLAARYARRLFVIDGNGSLYSSGTPKEVVTETMLREVYGVIATLNYDDKETPTISPICSARKVQDEEI
ncbi:MAG: ABC transporter ATP-binding protein [Bacillota bacterium]|jgi:iron complex transport system ATP-binding protein|nr:ABC transporter ATP-binding protein [Bacillota bacterium]NMB98594.1 ABC transporter ATP-binding protein [Clostridiaceae bacterium]